MLLVIGYLQLAVYRLLQIAAFILKRLTMGVVQWVCHVFYQRILTGELGDGVTF